MQSTIIINPGDAIRPAPLVEPARGEYLLITAIVEPQNRPGPVVPGRVRSEVLAELDTHARALRGSHPECTVQLFRAVAFPPFQATSVPARRQEVIGRYDVVALVTTAAAADELAPVEADPAYQGLLGVLRNRGDLVVVTKARNARRIAEVPAADRLHLFNFFLADDEPAALHVWEYLAGWYCQEMGMRDSEVLLPIEPDGTPFAFVNHASWNVSLARFVSRQMSRRSFRSFVIANLQANNIGSLPFLYRPWRAHGNE
jgi:hypothetical protein